LTKNIILAKPQSTQRKRQAMKVKMLERIYLTELNPKKSLACFAPLREFF
jgi:hypothetical protein